MQNTTPDYRPETAADEVDALYRAVKVLTTTPAIQAFLAANDPKALEQAEAAADFFEASIAREKVVEVEVYESPYETLGKYHIVGDFRRALGENGNYDLAAEVANNYDGEVHTDPELSSFYAYAKTAAEADKFTEFVKSIVPTAEFNRQS